MEEMSSSRVRAPAAFCLLSTHAAREPFRQPRSCAGTGLYGHSSVRRVHITDGRVLQKEALPHSWFGEGVTVCGRRCFQLLWREGMGLVRDTHTFELLSTFDLPRGVEGWGLTHGPNGLLYASDGSARIRVLDPHTLQETRVISVHMPGFRSRSMLRGAINELQWIHGYIWANLFHEERLVVIDPADGQVQFFVDLGGLLDQRTRRGLGSEDVLNGIAYDARGDRLFVTGKCWPKLFQIAVRPKGHRPVGLSREAVPVISNRS